MQRFATRFLVLVALCSSIFFVGPVGCSGTLQKDGVYQGDKLLYGAEKSITTSYKSFEAFLKWELDYRAILPVEVSRAADTIRRNAQKWIDSAIALRDAYAANPTSENRDRLQVSLSVIQAALAEAAKYQSEKRAIAPAK